MKTKIPWIILIVVICMLSRVTAQAGAPVIDWTVKYEVPTDDYGKGTTIVVDGTGNVFVTGVSHDISQWYGPDLVTIKYDTDGNQVWAQRLGPSSHDWPYSYGGIALDALGNVDIVASIPHVTNCNPPMGTIRYHSTGVRLLATSIWGDTCECHLISFAFDNLGNPYIGYDCYYDYEYPKAGIMKLGVWVKRDENAPPFFEAMTLDSSDSNLYLAGGRSHGVTGDHPPYDYRIVKIAADGTTKWTRHQDGAWNDDDWANAIAVDGSDNVYIAGLSKNGNKYNYGTLKYDADGNHKWTRYYIGRSRLVGSRTKTDNIARAIAVDGQGNVYVTGESKWSDVSIDKHYIDSATIKYDTNGIRQWVRRHHGGSGKIVRVDGFGNVYVLSGTCIIKYDSAGRLQWTYQSNTAWRDMVVDKARHVYVTGADNKKFTTMKMH